MQLSVFAGSCTTGEHFCQSSGLQSTVRARPSPTQGMKIPLLCCPFTGPNLGVQAIHNIDKAHRRNASILLLAEWLTGCIHVLQVLGGDVAGVIQKSKSSKVHSLISDHGCGKLNL